MNEIKEAATQLAGQNDRYLMIVAVLMLIAGGGIVIRYLVKYLERLQTRQESQSDKLVEVVVTCRSSLDNNTRVLERVEKKMLPVIIALFMLFTASGCAGAASMIRAAGKDASPSTLQVRTIYGTVIYSRGGATTNSVEVTATGDIKQNR
jgi:hypothetical protein